MKRKSPLVRQSCLVGQQHLAETPLRDLPCRTSNGEDNVKGVVNTANATSVKKGDVNATSSEAKSAKMAKYYLV
jgi:hypothetical protein